MQKRNLRTPVFRIDTQISARKHGADVLSDGPELASNFGDAEFNERYAALVHSLGAQKIGV